MKQFLKDWWFIITIIGIGNFGIVFWATHLPVLNKPQEKEFYQTCSGVQHECDYLIVVNGQTQCVIIRAYEPEKIK